MHACACNAHKRSCTFLYLVNSFLMVQKMGVIKKMKVAQEGPMHTHNDFHTSVNVHACMAAINMKRARMLDLISQAAYIRPEI